MPDSAETKYDANLLVELTEYGKQALESTGDASKYARSAAQTRYRHYRKARALLDTAGWTSAELRAVCEVLRGTEVEYSRSVPEQVAESMEAASVSQKGDISPERWAKMTRMVRGREPVARSVQDVVREYWGPSDHVDL